MQRRPGGLVPNTFGFYPTCVEQRHVRCLDDGREGLQRKIPWPAILLGILLVGPRTEANAKRKCRAGSFLDFSLRGCCLMGVASATTDGFLSTATEEDANYAADGPVCRHFRKLRALVSADRSDVILEMKHQARKILQVKTRGVFAIESPRPAPSRSSPGRGIGWTNLLTRQWRKFISGNLSFGRATIRQH